MMVNSEMATAVMMGISFTVVVTDNRGFGCINRLQMGTGGAEFNNLLDHAVHERPSAIDFAAHAAAMGATSRQGRRRSPNWKQALAKRDGIKGPYVVVIDTDPYPVARRMAAPGGRSACPRSASARRSTQPAQGYAKTTKATRRLRRTEHERQDRYFAHRLAERRSAGPDGGLHDGAGAGGGPRDRLYRRRARPPDAAGHRRAARLSRPLRHRAVWRLVFGQPDGELASRKRSRRCASRSRSSWR